MSYDGKGWFKLPKSVKLLDISMLGDGIILVIAIFIYFVALDQTVQNLMPIFLVTIILLFTWNFRSKLLSAPDQDSQKQYYREWIILCILVLVVIIVIILAYPVTY
ncbi:MAG: hypothetical protein ACTSQ9_05445 [Candidatus Hodarchaeales archaeon]|jgi:SNF family Na+-dependent transporter